MVNHGHSYINSVADEQRHLENFKRSLDNIRWWAAGALGAGAAEAYFKTAYAPEYVYTSHVLAAVAVTGTVIKGAETVYSAVRLNIASAKNEAFELANIAGIASSADGMDIADAAEIIIDIDDSSED